MCTTSTDARRRCPICFLLLSYVEPYLWNITGNKEPNSFNGTQTAVFIFDKYTEGKTHKLQVKTRDG
jgi:hypothetical protein